MKLYTGVVENRIDPLSLGRCQVRIVGVHTHDKNQLPTDDLPWSYPMQPVISAAMNGIGHTPIGPVEGTSVIVFFADDDMQQPIMLGTLGGIATPPGIIELDGNAPLTGSTKLSNLKLRTIPGPVSGNKLTFYDPESGRNDLTKDLKANMKVFGHDIAKETFIVSINSGTEITISSVVSNYVENIITFEAVPSNLDAVRQSVAQTGILVDGSGNPVVSGSGTPITTGSSDTPNSAASSNSSIPTVPPPKSSPQPAKSTDGIKALIAACDKVGLTTKEQKCALLGIAGGESRWIPQLESFNYSEARLKQVYSFATDEDVQKYGNATKKGVTREEFFSWAYGPTKRGKNFLGNKTDADGGKYFGRGFIQLTGRANYEKYQKLANQTGLNIDIVNNPDSLDADINVSALVAALYIKDRVKGVSPNEHPSYFLAAKKAVGVNTPDIAALKQNYYEYFYGLPGTGSEEKDAGPPTSQPPQDGDSSTPRPSEQSINSGAALYGFRDPNSKYPLSEYMGEPDTNRLARGVIEGTIVKKKDNTRVKQIPKALGQGNWDQPEAPFGAKYPYNKVFETESGHVQEFDDTPGQERIHTFHRSGTFQEVDPNGTQVNYIVGDNFVVMERNGCISVKGECNLTVEGNANIYVRTDANIAVENNATVEVRNNLSIGVATDTTLAVGGDMKMKIVGDLDIQAANIRVKSEGDFDSQATGGISVKGATTNIEAEGASNYLSGGSTNMDYSVGNFGNGASGANDVEAIELPAPALGDPINPIVPYLIPPEREFEERTVVETPDDLETPEGRAKQAEDQRKTGIVGAPAPEASESAPAPRGGATAKTSVDCSIIFSTKSFTGDYRLSKNFTLGMLISGGFGGKHKLIDQQLKENKESAERTFTVQEIVCNLANTVQNILEPALEVLPGGIGGYNKQWAITSGYRLKGVVPYESPTSDHCKGRAVDIGLLVPDRYNKTYEIIQQMEKVCSYDQMILEYRHPDKIWIHSSFNVNGGRKTAFTMVNDKTFDKNGFVLVSTIPPRAA
jgi:predicted chitinase